MLGMSGRSTGTPNQIMDTWSSALLSSWELLRSAYDPQSPELRGSPPPRFVTSVCRVVVFSTTRLPFMKAKRGM
jgi:hypothetical protein